MSKVVILMRDGEALCPCGTTFPVHGFGKPYAEEALATGIQALREKGLISPCAGCENELIVCSESCRAQIQFCVKCIKELGIEKGEDE